MVKPFRVLDSGVIEGRLNIAIGQALVESRQAGKSPDTLRFLRFPPTALIGRHQQLWQGRNRPGGLDDSTARLGRILLLLEG